MPSLINSTRPAWLAAFTEWVTIRMVWPWRLTSLNSSSRLSVDLESGAPGGFVRQHESRLGNQGTGHSGALFLTAGNLIGVLLQQAGDAQLIGPRE